MHWIFKCSSICKKLFSGVSFIFLFFYKRISCDMNRNKKTCNETTKLIRKQFLPSSKNDEQMNDQLIFYIITKLMNSWYNEDSIFFVLLIRFYLLHFNNNNIFVSWHSNQFNIALQQEKKVIYFKFDLLIEDRLPIWLV